MPLASDVVVGGKLTTIQCDQLEGGTLLSISVTATLFAFGGTPVQESAGDRFPPPQRVYTCSFGTTEPPLMSALVSSIARAGPTSIRHIAHATRRIPSRIWIASAFHWKPKADRSDYQRTSENVSS